MDPANPHLGGYRVGGDEATYFPELYLWAVNELKVESVLDVGCGEGQTLRFFEALLPGAVTGIDGVFQPHPAIHQHDYTDDTFLVNQSVDLVWCSEMLEHLDEQFLPNLLETFTSSKAKLIMITHAFPGQAGHNHINCRNPQYWLGVFAAIGYRFDELLTAQAKAKAAFNQSPWNHFVRSGMVFVRY